jgi:hypothetical protein
MQLAGDRKYANGDPCKAYVMTKNDFAIAYRRKS